MSLINNLKEWWISNDGTEQDKEVIQSFEKTQDTIDALERMKATDGWKLIEKKIKEDIQTELNMLISENSRLDGLFDVLQSVETKSKQQLLDEQIKQLLNI